MADELFLTNQIGRLRTDIDALRHYVGHIAPCKATYLAGRVTASSVGVWNVVRDNPPACVCGLDDVLRGVDARTAGRIVEPVSKTETTGDDDGN